MSVAQRQYKDNLVYWPLTRSNTNRLRRITQTMSVEELNRMFSFSIASGSIEKSTSESKKKEAMMLMQVLGQFGTGMPMTVMSLVLKI